MSNHDHGGVPNTKASPIASSRTMKYAQRRANARTSPDTAETMTAGHFSLTDRFSSPSASSEITETSDLLLTPWPRHSKISTTVTMSSWDFSPTPTASIVAMSTPPSHPHWAPLPDDGELYAARTQIAYSTRESDRAPPSCPPSSSMISAASLWPDDGISYIDNAKDQSSISHYSYHQPPMQTPPSLPPPSIPSQWLIIAPPFTYTALALPPPGYILWVPISQPPGLTFFKPSGSKLKLGDIEASPIPSDWQYRNTFQRENWVEMTIFQKVPIIRKKRSHWRCGLKGCKWTTEGGLLPNIATEYLVHQFEVHEFWWSRSGEGRVHLNRLKGSLGL